MEDELERGSSLADRSLNRTARHVQDLLDLALIRQGGLALCREPTALPAVMLEVLDAVCDLAARKRLALEMVPGRGAILLSSDPERLFRLLENLVRWVIARTPAGGRVVIHPWSTHGFVALDVHGISPGIPMERYLLSRLQTPPKIPVRKDPALS
ncbi:MAG TPA: hypothetical protein VFX59_26170, partial [Polyangiales bacterium]|nr:hypothetical protein [Polyangiales bacterium]